MSSERLIGRKIVKADVNGYGIELILDDGSIFLYDASDGGYSTYGFEDEGADND